jgi:hypothetical protein
LSQHNTQQDSRTLVRALQLWSDRLHRCRALEHAAAAGNNAVLLANGLQRWGSATRRHALVAAKATELYDVTLQRQSLWRWQKLRAERALEQACDARLARRQSEDAAEIFRGAPRPRSVSP